ncbi:MAG: hypothetical protein CMJ59_00720, partial [Planctomycetaceae bacterium]|nr:hypothetical protein [Planctomycetaceae bacterium]
VDRTVIKAQPDPPPQIVGHWSFDEGRGESASDSSGNGHHGAVRGAQWCPGKKGTALRFDGRDDYVDCGTAAQLNLTKAFTIEAWINPQDPVHHNMTVVAKGYRYAGNYHLRMGTPWNRSKLMLVSQQWRTHEIPIALNQWHHVVGVCDGQRVGLFVDDRLVSVRPFVTTLKANDTPMTIGKCVGAPAGPNPKLAPPGEPFKGMIDEVRIYDGVLEKYRLSGTTGAEINRGVRTITTRGEWGEYEGFPGVCRLANGDLLAVFYAGRDHMGWPHPELPRRGRICLMRSIDEGATWSKPKTLIDEPIGERDPSISQLKDGTVICTYYGTIWYERGRTCDVYTIRSRDNGQTWHETPAKVPAPWYTEAQRQDVIAKAGPPATVASNRDPIREEFKAINATRRPVRELSDGTLILPIYGQYGDEPYRCALARSRDGGKTWGDVSMISETHHHCEPDVIELPDRRLLCVMRPCMCRSFSTDQGRTWSEPTRLLRGEAPSLFLTSDRVVLCGHRERPGTRTGLIMSTDDGETWGLPRMIDFAGGAYPSFVELKDGRILCLHYQEAAGGNIRQAIFAVDRAAKQIRLTPNNR